MAEGNKGNGKKDKSTPDDGNPEFENFQQLLRQVLAAPKEKIDERRVECERERGQKRAR